MTSRPSAGKATDNASLVVDRGVEAGRGAKLACIASDATLTYEQLRLQVNRMGHVLRELGVRREQRVLLALDDTTAFPIAFLGAMRIGAVPVPVSGRDTTDNFRYFVEDSYAEVVVCDAASLPALRHALEGYDVRYVVRGGDAVDDTVDFDSALAAQDGELSVVARTHPDDMAFWLYSSGSTGMPKGVVHLHRNVEAICETFARCVLDIREEDRIFATSKLHHAYALGNSLWFSLYFGATAVLLDGPPQPERLLSTLRQQQPTVLFSVPALYALLAGDPSADDALESVRLCVSASAPLPVQTFERWRGRFGLEIVDGIGSTEMLSTFCSNRPGKIVPGTTGQAVPGYELRLTDDSGAVLEGAAVGALEVRGESCAAYYWHQREKAKHSMRGEWFLSGDRYERREDGSYVYVGRTDDMLKVGGLWVSPVDIERVLIEHPAVAEVGVVGVVIDDHTRIAAVVRCSEGASGDEELAHVLREWCKERMRDYEYPHIVRFVEELPRTLTGKPQRFKLRELVEQQVQGQDYSNRPRRLRDFVNDTLRRGKSVTSAEHSNAVDSEQSVTAGDHGKSTGGEGEDVGVEVKPAAKALSLSLTGAPAHERARMTIELVCAETASVLGHGSADTVEPQRAFKELGFDSVAAVELRNRLSIATGLELLSTLVFDHPTPADLARYLCRVADGSELSAQTIGAAHMHTDEPIAIIGMSCRYPGGVCSPEDLWRLVATGTDAISEFPTERGWQLDRLYNPDPDNLGTSYVRAGGFLYDAAEFDAGFFGISPREAMTIDPQQRLLLEASWEVFEDAEIDPMGLRGSDTGVFAGVMYQDYGLALGLRSRNPDAEGYALLGSSGSVASGRIAYAFDLEGPAVTVDTACSSSLVALHLAGQSLRSGECSLALAGGVTVMATPGPFLEYSRQRGLAADGRCKSFAEAADGTGFSEGVGLVLLERLSDALLNGHRVLATIRGSAVNQDGASNGLTAPSGPSQERVIRQALANARLSVDDIGVVEAHGTGTSLGDPIEAHALLATYGRDREEGRPLWLGSVKSNIGHSQAAAGVAGVIKMVKAFEHGLLPKTLHVDEPSRHVDWSKGAVRLLTEEVVWPGDDRPRRAAVSSFGVSGTNAHVILEESALRDGRVAGTRTHEDRVGEGTPEPAGSGVGHRAIDGRGAVAWVLSGKGQLALRAQAGQLHRFVMGNPDLGVGDVGLALARRSTFESRAVVIGGDRESLAAGVRAVESGQSMAHVISGAPTLAGGAGVAYVFPGQGSQWNGMAVRLLDESPVFAELMRECADALSRYVDWSLDGVLRGHAEMPGLDRIDVVQPALFAVMVSLAGLWRACGVEPAAVVGHSQGEIAAVHVSGGLSLDDAARVVALRSQLLSRLAGEGGIVSVALPAAEVMSRLARWDGRIGLAGVNGPTSATVSGDEQALAEFVDMCVAEDVRARMVPDTVASHSARVDEFHDELCEVLASISPRTGDVPFYSTVTGGLLDTAELDAEYWFENMRRPVLFEQATRALLGDGFRVFIEASPHPVLTFGIQETVDEALGASSDVVVGDSLRRGEDGVERFLTALGEAWVRGVSVDWGRVLAGSAAKHVGLPPYAFQRERFWLEAGAGVDDVTSIGLGAVDHPWLGAGVELGGGGGWLFAGRVSREKDKWLSDREFMGAVLFPGAGLLDLVLHAGRELGCAAVRDLTLDAPLALPERGGVQIQVLVGERGEDGTHPVSVFSRPQGRSGGLGADGVWTRHVTGVLVAESDDGRENVDTFGGVWPPEGAVDIELVDLYARLASLGLDYGPAFQGLTGMWRRGDDVFCETGLLEGQVRGAGSFTVHPVLLDTALHAAALINGAEESLESDVCSEFSWGDVQFGRAHASSLKIRVSQVGSGHDGELSILALDESGGLVVSARSVVGSPITRDQLRGADGGVRRSQFHLDWTPLELGPIDEGTAGDTHTWAVLGQEDLEIVRDLERTGVNLVAYPHLGALGEALDGGVEPPSVVMVDARAALVGEEDGDEEALNVVDGAHRLVHEVLGVLQGWLADERLAGSCLVVLSREAVRVRSDDGLRGLASAGVWGLVRSAQSEDPGCAVLIDSGDTDCVDASLLQIALATAEPQLAIRDGKLWAPRLTRVTAGSHEDASLGESGRALSSPDLAKGTVLVTGGTGCMGMSLARHLVEEHCVQSLVLASRHGLDAPGATELQAQLESRGAQVKIVACDVSDRDAMQRLLRQIPADLPLRGVVHCAGVSDDVAIGSLSEEHVERTFAPKVDAAWQLHELTQELDLSMFALFSSAAGTLGGVGQGSYAAANAFLDSLAAYRRARGRAGMSIAWGPWEYADGVSNQIGSADLARIERTGMGALSLEQGLGIFDAACASGEELTLAASLDLGVLRAQARAGVLPVLLDDLVRVSRRHVGEQGWTLERRLASVPEAERERVTLEIVRGHVALVLGHASAEAIDPRRAFKELGFDSLAAVELRNRLNAVTGLRLPATLAFDYPTATAVSSYLLSEISGLKEKAASTVSAMRNDEPIAIVGMSCRYPGGANSPQGLWDLLVDGTDVISSFPEDRGWDVERLYDPDPDHPGTSYAREGGFLYDVGDFDADFFGISPREALAMDPQQRLLLEASWEALESAGIDPVSLRGSQAGVYVGISSSDYETGLSGLSSDGLAGYRLTGGASSVASGRVSYAFGLEGPAVSVDTACSSSLVALHMACGGLRSDECSLALAGGVTVMSSPGAYVEFSAQRGLASDGRCKSFAASADGIGWSEGVGMVLLERLSDARRLGHRVLAVVRGSAINQDGASNGLTAPNGPSQQRVITQALANAGLAARQVDVVEAHGTGTTLGDPVEAQALLATYGSAARGERPLWLGSVKSNIGHAAAAAGVAGVIKMVMAMRNDLLPRTLHVDEPSREVDWSAGAVSLLTDDVAWQREDEPRRAGVSSFGVSGTNAHMILEEPPEELASPPDADVLGEAEPDVGQGRVIGVATSSVSGETAIAAGYGHDACVAPWVLSAKGEGALRAQAERLLEHVDISPGLDLDDVGFSLATRTAFERRAVVTGDTREERVECLRALARGRSAGRLVHGGPFTDGGLGLLFPGQGSQWDGMAVELLEESPVFAERMSECAEALSRYVDWSVEGALRGETNAPGLERVDVVQPLLFAVMVSLAGMWRACGVRPDAVIGHSQGEIAAACVAGGLSLDDAARVVAVRSRVLADLSGKGGMLSIALGAEDVVGRIAHRSEQIALAAVNGPSSVVVSGEPKALEELLGECVADGVRARMIPVDYAAHSQQVESIRSELLDGCEGITPRSGDIPFYSSVTGGLLDTAELDAEYWYRNLRETVQFERTARIALEQGRRAFIEVGPHPVLAVGLLDTIDTVLGGTGDALVVGSLRRGEGGLERFLTALAEAWVGGVAVDWKRVFAGSGAERVELPTYAFQRERFWFEEPGSRGGDMASAGQATADHPLLGAAVALAGERGWLFTGLLSLQSYPWLSDHAVMGTVLLPGTVLLELALYAGGQVGCGVVEELVLEAPVVLTERGGVQLQVSVGEPDQSGRRAINIHTRAEHSSNGDTGAESWTLHASGVLNASNETLRGVDARERAAALTAEVWPPVGAEIVEIDGLYDELHRTGIEYGPAFQGLRKVWRRGEDVFAEVILPAEQSGDAERFGMHPALLGAALQATGVAVPDGLGIPLPGWPEAASPAENVDAQEGLRLPFSWQDVELYSTGASSVRAHLAPIGDGSVSVVLVGESGRLVGAVGALASRPLAREHLQSVPDGHRGALHAIDWTSLSISLERSEDDGTELVVLGGANSLVAQEVNDPEVELAAYRDLHALAEAIEQGFVLPGAVLLDAHDLLGDIGGEYAAGDGSATGDALGSGSTSNRRTDGELDGHLDVMADMHMPEKVRGVVCGVLGVLQGWLSDERFAGCRLVVVTRHTLSPSTGDGVWGLAGSGVWGLVRSAQSEHPDRFVLIDIDDQDERESEGRRSLGELLRAALACGEPQLAIRDGELLLPRLSRVGSDNSVVDPPAPVEIDGTTLITGGTGGLGALIARHLVSVHGVQSVMLVSRRGLEAPGAERLKEELESLGAYVLVEACDVADREAVRGLLERAPSEFPLRGVVHAAGARENGVIGSLRAEDIEKVLAPKVDGAWHLHQLTRDLDLSMFVLFSSVAGILGFPGQGNYAAANTFLDAIATYRRAYGLAGASIAWGYWDQASDTADTLDEGDLARVARQGVLPISVQEGLDLFDRAQVAERAALAAVRIDPAVARSRAGNGQIQRLMRNLVRAPVRRAVEGESLNSRLATVSDSERDSVTLDLVRGEVAIVLGHSSAGAIDPERAFKDLGFDSLASVELRNRLNAATGLRLSATVAFDHPNATILARHLLEQAGGVEQRRLSLPARNRNRGEDLIAIVGMSCRYPGGVRSPRDLWDLVAGRRDAIGEFPADRGWDLERLFDPDPGHPGTSYAREGGFLYDVAEFDAEFFGISPREALAMDSQQRLLLEVSWEAIEGAYMDPTTLRGSQTGVFTGVTYHDYGTATARVPEDLEGYMATGVAGSVASGRVAYMFGLEGPAITVDTACSSSLVAMHWACHSLRSNECSLALAGGVAVLASPAPFLEFSRQRGLAVDGRCKAFGAGADGIGFAEGVGVVLLERLSDAQRNGRRVLAVVRGSAVNQDGASNGLTAPNGPSQERVIRQALANAELSTTDVDVVEAHGTGTSLGDPIEAQALLATYGRDRPRDNPLRLGSVKSNIGHTQAAAGVAGVIKMVMAMESDALPSTLHAAEPSKHVDWSSGAVSLLNEQEPWAPNGKPRRAGVSSFGISGTNAHVILEEAPVVGSLTKGRVASGASIDPVDVDVPPLPAFPWVLSGRGAMGLQGQAERLLESLMRAPELGAGDVGLSLAARSDFKDRAVIVGGAWETLVGGLGAVAGKHSAAGVVSGCDCDGETAFMFTGQGSQRVGMGRELYDAFGVFRDAFDRVCAELDKSLDCSLKDLVLGPAGASRESGRMDDTACAQPALFALEVALFRLLEHWGVRPDLLIGHSVGEVVAAHIAGVFSLEDACVLVAARGRLMGGLSEGGAMASVGASEQEVSASLDGFEGRVVIAGVNGPRSVVVSGDEDAVLSVCETWRERGLKTKRLRVSHAFHSPRMDEMLSEFAVVLDGLSFAPPSIPIVSNLTGEVAPVEDICSVEYWVRHVREPVRFMDGVRWLSEHGVRRFFELGPDGVLSGMVQECLDGYGEVDGLEEDRRSGGGLSISGDEVPPVSAPTLRGERPEVESIFTALGEMWVHGVEVDWTGVLDGRGFTHVELPSYAFQRKRFWLDGGSGAGDVRSIGLESIDHPLLGAVVELAGGEGWLFSGRVSLKDSAWLLDHVVMDTILFPGTGLLDIVVCAGQAIGCDVVRELVLEAPLVFDGVQDMRLQVMVGGSQRDGERSVSVFSCPGDRSDVLDGGSVDGEGWTRHASGVLVATGSEDANASRDLAFGSSVGADAMWPPQGANRIEVDDLYERLADVGLDYGPAFQGLTGAWQRGDEIFCEASLLEEHMARAGSFAVHPALLDSALHGVGLLNTGGWSSDRAQGKADMRLPFSWENVRVLRNGARSLRVRLAIPSERNNRVDAEGEADRSDGVVSLVAVDESGMPVVSVGSLLTRVVSSEQLQAMRGNPSESLFDVQWRGLQTGVSTGDAFGASEDWVLLGSDDSRLGHVLGNTGTGVRVHKDLHALREATDDSQASAPEVVLMDATDSAINESYGGEDTPIDGDLAARAKVIACAVLSVLQDWISDERFAESRLVLVSSEAVRAGIDDRLAGLSSSGVWGMVRSAQSEHPGRLMLIDIDRREGGEGIEETQLGVLLKTAIASREPQLAIRDGVVLVPMLARVTMGAMDGAVDDDDDARESNANAKSVAVGAGGSILITGGTGGLGALVARHLVVEHHVGCVVLVSRSGLKAPGADELKAELVRLGAQVHVAACDVSNREAVAGLLEEIPVEFPLRGVIHAAGALDDGMIGSLTSESVERVFAPKVEGAWNLHELTADMDLSMFMLFSSGAGTMGAPGQSNYAAANAFLDSLAAYRRARGLQGTSIAWGLWEQAGGMTSGLEVADMARLARTGVIALTAAEGLELFDAACGSSEASLVAARFDKRVLRADARAGMLHVLLRGMTRTPAQRVADDGSLMRQLAGLSEVEQESLILDLVRREVATVLGHMSHTTIDPHIAFKDLGFDSLAAVELRNRLNAATGLRLSATLIFDYPNAAVLTHRLRDELRPSNAELAGESEETEVRKVLASIPLGRLRRAGLLDMLLQLGDHVDPAERSAAVDDPDTVDTMGIEDLVLAATRGSEGEADERI